MLRRACFVVTGVLAHAERVTAAFTAHDTAALTGLGKTFAVALRACTFNDGGETGWTVGDSWRVRRWRVR